MCIIQIAVCYSGVTEQNEERWAFNFLADLVTEMETEGKAGSSTASNVKAVKSWLSHNGVQVTGSAMSARTLSC